MIYIKLDKIELSKLLSIKKDNLIKLEQRDQLQEKLYIIGYKLIDKIKEGKKIYYILEQIENNPNLEVYNNLCKYVYNTNKPDEFGTYFVNRNSNIIGSKKDISNISKVSDKTITKWDNTLIDYEILLKDGFYYFCIDKSKNIIYECTPEEYKSFWKDKGLLKAFRELQLKFVKGIISLSELQVASSEATSTVTLIENKYYYRIKKYKTNEENKLYIDTMQLIKNIYGDNVPVLTFISDKRSLENKP